MPHTVTQARARRRRLHHTATVEGDWAGLLASATDTEVVPLVRSTAFTVALASDVSDFDTVGAVITYTVTVTNAGDAGRCP